MTSTALARDIVTARFMFNAIKGNRYQDQLKDAIVGDYKWSARTGDFAGWLICDGRSLSRVTYSDLYAIIGTSFGSSSGTTFNLPDCRGKVAGAVGQGSGLTNRSIGATAGSETQILTVDQLPSHTHDGTTSINGSHTHTTNAPGGQDELGLAIADGTKTVINTDPSEGELNVWTTPRALVINNAGNHNHSFTTNATGGNAAFNIMQPTIFLGNVFLYSGIFDPLEPTVYTDGKGDDEYTSRTN